MRASRANILYTTPLRAINAQQSRRASTSNKSWLYAANCPHFLLFWSFLRLFKSFLGRKSAFFLALSVSSIVSRSFGAGKHVLLSCAWMLSATRILYNIYQPPPLHFKYIFPSSSRKKRKKPNVSRETFGFFNFYLISTQKQNTYLSLPQNGSGQAQNA